MKQISLMLVILLFASPLVMAQTIEQEAGITPDSPIWKLEVAMEKIMMALTFQQKDKINYGLKIAEERLAEMKVMISKNKPEFIGKIEEERNRIVNQMYTQEMTKLTEQNKIQIMQKLEQHTENMEQFKEQLQEQTRNKLEISTKKSSEVLENMKLKFGKK